MEMSRDAAGTLTPLVGSLTAHKINPFNHNLIIIVILIHIHILILTLIPILIVILILIHLIAGAA